MVKINEVMSGSELSIAPNEPHLRNGQVVDEIRCKLNFDTNGTTLADRIDGATTAGGYPIYAEYRSAPSTEEIAKRDDEFNGLNLYEFMSLKHFRGSSYFLQLVDCKDAACSSCNTGSVWKVCGLYVHCLCLNPLNNWTFRIQTGTDISMGFILGTVHCMEISE